MNILYIHQYFKTPSEPGGTRSYWMAKELINRGHKVIMLAASNKYESRVHKVNIDGIDVIYIKEEYNQNMSVARRARSFLKFMLKSCRITQNEKNIDIVIATSTPLTVGVPALIRKWTKRTPFVFEVRDLWPEVPIQMGALNNPLLRWGAIKLEKTIYKNAKHIIALSPGMRDGVLKYENIQKTSMIPNMAKKDVFYPRPRNLSLLNQLGLRENSFKIIHFGALGIANGAQSVINSAKLLKGDNSVEFMFLGGGAEEDILKSMCNELEINNVHFLGKFPMKETSEIVNMADISIVSFKDLPILYTNSPNKLFDSLSAGKPIIVNSAGWTKELVEDNECGYYVDPNKPEQLAGTIKYLQEHPDVVQTMGDKSRKLAENVYDKSLLTRQFADIIEA